MRRPLLKEYMADVERLLKAAAERFSGVRIDYYSILPDHLHVIFILDNANTTVGNIVRTFKAGVTRTTGHKPFWEWNYYEHIIRDERALYNIRKYINENPLKEEIDWNNIYRGINAPQCFTL